MSLREEIFNVIKNAKEYAKKSNDNNIVGVGKIDEDILIVEDTLIAIEKRIDSIQALGDGNYFGYSGDEEFIDGFDIGFVEAFKLIKKEMLK